jgi:aquaporin Z
MLHEQFVRPFRNAVGQPRSRFLCCPQSGRFGRRRIQLHLAVSHLTLRLFRSKLSAAELPDNFVTSGFTIYDLRFAICDLRFATKVTCFLIMNRLLSEFLGTFFLTFTICVAAVYGKAGDYGPLAIGFVLVAMVYACGHISKAHFNPAVSLAFLIRGCYISVKEMFSFIGVQCLAAILAALLARGLYSDGVIVETTDLIFVPALVAEILFTFMLVWVIMNVATAKANQGNDFYGIAIGFTVAGAIYTVGIVSLAVLNPAVAIALVLVGKLSLSQIAIPIFGSLLGGLGAVLLFNLGHPTEGCSDDDESGCSPIK